MDPKFNELKTSSGSTQPMVLYGLSYLSADTSTLQRADSYTITDQVLSAGNHLNDLEQWDTIGPPDLRELCEELRDRAVVGLFRDH